MRTSVFLSVVVLVVLFSLPGYGARIGRDLSVGIGEGAQLLIVTGVTQPVVRLETQDNTPFAPQYPNDRTLVVDRVLYGTAMAKGTELPFVVDAGHYNGMPVLVDAAPMLLCLRHEGERWVFSGTILYYLGPVFDGMLPLKSLDDPQVDTVQRMVDIASNPSAGASWERVQALLPGAQHDPVMLDFLLKAQDHLFVGLQQDFYRYLTGMVSRPDAYAPASLVFADQLLTGNDPLGGIGWRDKVWLTSSARKQLFAALDARVQPDDPSRTYIDYVLKSPSGEQAWPAPQAANPRDLSAALGDPRMSAQGVDDPYNNRFYAAPPFVAVVKSPGVGTGRHTVEILRVLMGETPWVTPQLPVIFEKALPAGTYVLLMTGMNGNETPAFGRQTFVLGSVIDALPVTSPYDPAVEDIQRLLMLIGQPQTARWQRSLDRDLNLLGLNVAKHPLILNYYLRSQVGLIREAAATRDTALQQILNHPDVYPVFIVVLADGLFGWQRNPDLLAPWLSPWLSPRYDMLTPAARAWHDSPRRRELLEGLLARLTPEDREWPYPYLDLAIDTALRSFGQSRNNDDL